MFLPLFWGILAGILLIIELIVPTLISIWLSIAAFIVMFLAFYIKDIGLQLIIFSLISILLIFTTRTFLKNILKNDKDSFNSQMLGEKVIITKVLNKNYEVKYKGVIWDAISDEKFELDDVAIIKAFKGNKIILRKEVKK